MGKITILVALCVVVILTLIALYLVVGTTLVALIAWLWPDNFERDGKFDQFKAAIGVLVWPIPAAICALTVLALPAAWVWMGRTKNG